MSTNPLPVEPEAPAQTNSPEDVRDFISRYATFLDHQNDAGALSESASAVAAAAGASVYEDKLSANPPVQNYRIVPQVVYYYYIRLESDNRLTVLHYKYTHWEPIQYDALQGVVNNVAQQALVGALASQGSDFKDIEWRHKSYIVFLVDEEHWRFNQEGSPIDAILFKNGNHTFFDAKNFDIALTDPQTNQTRYRSAIAMINHMKEDANGGNLGAVPQNFKFDIVFNVKFVNQTDARMIVVFDPDTTNIGPPLPPPPEP